MRCIPVLLIVFFSTNSIAQNKDIDFHKAAWKPIDTSGYYEYFNTKSGTTPGIGDKRVILKMIGWLKKDSNKIKFPDNESLMFLSIAETELNTKNFTQLPMEGSEGYIKMDFKKYLFNIFRNQNQFTVFFTSDYSHHSLQQDSIRLSHMNIFREINIMTQEKAIAKYSADNDTTWKQFIDSNPLPVSLELKLNDSFLGGNKFDAVKLLLEKELPGKTEIQESPIGNLLGNDLDQNAILIFKFIIFSKY
jgi:hypothetical protein